MIPSGAPAGCRAAFLANSSECHHHLRNSQQCRTKCRPSREQVTSIGFIVCGLCHFGPASQHGVLRTRCRAAETAESLVLVVAAVPKLNAAAVGICCSSCGAAVSFGLVWCSCCQVSNVAQVTAASFACVLGMCLHPHIVRPRESPKCLCACTSAFANLYICRYFC